MRVVERLKNAETHKARVAKLCGYTLVSVNKYGHTLHSITLSTPG